MNRYLVKTMELMLSTGYVNYSKPKLTTKLKTMSKKKIAALNEYLDHVQSVLLTDYDTIYVQAESLRHSSIGESRLGKELAWTLAELSRNMAKVKHTLHDMQGVLRDAIKQVQE